MWLLRTYQADDELNVTLTVQLSDAEIQEIIGQAPGRFLSTPVSVAQATDLNFACAAFGDDAEWFLDFDQVF